MLWSCTLNKGKERKMSRIVTSFIIISLLCAGVAEAAGNFRLFKRRTVQHTASQPASTAYEPAERDCPVWQTLSDEEKAFITALDKYRAERGLPQLILVERIVEDSRRWAGYLSRTNRFYHGSGQENLAVGSESGERILRQWRDSPGHNAKLLSRQDTVCGIGNVGRIWAYRAATTIEVYHVGKKPEDE